MTIEFVVQARTPRIADLVERCARGDLPYADLVEEVDRMGYRTTSLFEMVRATEAALAATGEEER